MKKIFFTVLACVAISISILQAQPTDRPLHNFYVDKETTGIFYQEFFTVDSNMSAKTIVTKLREALKGSDNISNLTVDGSNVLRGHIQNVSVDYYSSNRKLEGDFNIVVKDGKYRVYIHDMFWNIQSDLDGGKDKLENMNINSRGTEWKMFAYNIFPDLDAAFIKVFTLDSPSKPVMKSPSVKSDTTWEVH